MWTKIAAEITQATGKQFEIEDRQSISGGCINQAYVISNVGGASQSDSVSQRLKSPLVMQSLPTQTKIAIDIDLIKPDCEGSPTENRQRYFVKINRSSLLDMFAAEARGLTEIAATKTIRVPLPICWGVAEEHSYLVLEHLDLEATDNPQSWKEMGRNLAKMHQCRISPNLQFGWHIDNTIGSTTQINTWEDNWATFFTNHRIGYQLELAQSNGGNFPKAAQLIAKIPQLLANYRPKPSLVHGDLWSGNASFTTTGIPVIFDPATYWGDREVDVAMAALFGGFPNAFYQGYNDVYPLDSDYSIRKNLYDLYHILNHHNLFGGNYQGQANNMIDRLLW